MAGFPSQVLFNTALRCSREFEHFSILSIQISYNLRYNKNRTRKRHIDVLSEVVLLFVQLGIPLFAALARELESRPVATASACPCQVQRGTTKMFSPRNFLFAHMEVGTASTGRGRKVWLSNVSQYVNFKASALLL